MPQAVATQNAHRSEARHGQGDGFIRTSSRSHCIGDAVLSGSHVIVPRAEQGGLSDDELYQALFPVKFSRWRSARESFAGAAVFRLAYSCHDDVTPCGLFPCSRLSRTTLRLRWSLPTAGQSASAQELRPLPKYPADQVDAVVDERQLS